MKRRAPIDRGGPELFDTSEAFALVSEEQADGHEALERERERRDRIARERAAPLLPGLDG